MLHEPTDSPVMQDFVFGALETDANTLAAERQRWSGIRHHHAIDPLDPLPGQPVTITVTVGRDALVERVVAYVTTDGSQPAGARGAHGRPARLGMATMIARLHSAAAGSASRRVAARLLAAGALEMLARMRARHDGG